MSKPTAQQIKDELSRLIELRDKIPPRNAFGDSNLERIDAEIDVLTNNRSDREIDLIYGDDETAYEYTGNPSPDYESAGYARQWLDGEALDGDMSDSWKELVGVKVKPIKQ